MRSRDIYFQKVPVDENEYMPLPAGSAGEKEERAVAPTLKEAVTEESWAVAPRMCLKKQRSR